MLDFLENLPVLTKQNQAELIVRSQAKLQRGIEAKKVFSGVFFHVWQWPQELYDGSQATFESISRADTVTILAFDKAGQVIMTKQSQPGFQQFWSMPGGIIDEGEEVWQAAKRELLEETGYQSEKWQFLFSGQMNSRIDWANFYLVAQDCTLVADKNLDAGEKIEIELLAWPDFTALLKKVEFRNSDFVLWWWRQIAK